nr:ribosome silencing factor [Indioceanicola profundi]
MGSPMPHLAADLPERIRDLVVQSLEDDKAEDTVVIDLQGKTSLADFMVVTTGRSARQVGSMADHLLEKLKALGVAGVEAEGAPQCDWVLIDAGDVIVHLFRPEVRAFYNIEKMWGVEPPASLLNAGPSEYLPT